MLTSTSCHFGASTARYASRRPGWKRGGSARFAHIARSARHVCVVGRNDKLSVGMQCRSCKSLHSSADRPIPASVPRYRSPYRCPGAQPPAENRSLRCIVMGYQPEPDFVSEPLFKEEICPVCAPNYLKGRDPPHGTSFASHFDDAAYCGHRPRAARSWCTQDWARAQGPGCRHHGPSRQ
jgi:hypothetical protein